jgi:hypothetical protein
VLKDERYFVVKKNHFYMLYPDKINIISLKIVIFITPNKHKINSIYFVKSLKINF